MIRYATVDQAKAETNVPSSSNPDAYLKQALYFVSGRIEEEMEQEFAPRKEARGFDALGDHIDGDTLYLENDPFLEIVSIVDGTGATLTAYNPSTQTGDYILIGQNTPYRAIARRTGSWSSYSGDWRKAITITAYWGVRKRYSEAWPSANDTITSVGGINASATTFTVADSDGADVYGVTPRFSPGMLIRADSEYMEVVDVNHNTNTLTVRRGIRGTDAAAHNQGAVIYRFVPDSVVTRAAARWAAYLLARQGAFETSRFDGVAVTNFPPDMPQEVRNILDSVSPLGMTAV